MQQLHLTYGIPSLSVERRHKLLSVRTEMSELLMKSDFLLVVVPVGLWMWRPMFLSDDMSEPF